DWAENTVTVVTAGHPPPLLYRAGTKTYENGCTMDQTGYPLGVQEGTLYDCNIVTLAAGDCVILYTDGITESKNRTEKDFGMDGLLTALNAGPMTPVAIGKRLIEMVHRHAAGRKAHDDLTVVTFGRLA